MTGRAPSSDPARPPVSAAIITLDAARTIDAALASVAFCDEIVVLDSGSTDGTLERAHAAGARVAHRDWTGFRDQKNAVAGLCRHDWILSIDADEAVSPPLAEEIEGLFHGAAPYMHAYTIPRLTRYLGRDIRTAGWYPDRAVRLYDRRRGRWVGGQVHERIEVEGEVGALDGNLRHDPYETISHHVAKMNDYTTLAAETMHARDRRAGWTDWTLRPPLVFIKKYLMRGGLVQGVPGFMVSASTAMAVCLKYLKLWDLQRRGVAPDPDAGADASPPDV